MQNALTFPYRRFSSEMYASSLIELLDANAIPFEIVSEPEGMGSVFTGMAGIPGIIVMVSPADAKKVQALEKPVVPGPEEVTSEEKESTEQLINVWVFFGYTFALLAAPLSIFFGYHVMTSRRRQPDLSYDWAYPEATRSHGKAIFWIAIILLLVSFLRVMFAGEKANILNALSFVLSFLTR